MIRAAEWSTSSGSRALYLLKTLLSNDLRLGRRQFLLYFMLAYPLVWALVLRWGLSPFTEWLRPTFDLEPYYALIASGFLLLGPPLVFGFVIGFLLLDERDDRTLSAMQVTPLPFAGYLAYRCLVPVVLGIVMIWIIVPLADMVEISFLALTATAVVAALEGAAAALFVAVAAGNKVEGFALVKALGALPLAAVVAYFVESKWQLAFGVLPTYWPSKAFWIAVEGGGGFWVYLVVGLVFHLGLLWLCFRRFDRVVLS